ncbi:IclR family transcriptional regulator [Rhizobium sp. PP-F2F-G48]|uniref:IclR family transcriptional regulator n=1 Tax=Rhizobium sp. PP-F2F-G48 TaxID=2135651 RepID=UPI001042CDB0|nr:IclR family transcriptional regulator [Rhizobium sp. PP-F2F-G48]TCM55857.1 IclR family transcriptional regulator [Rhizobium sp. PP-F2F-G48]
MTAIGDIGGGSDRGARVEKGESGDSRAAPQDTGTLGKALAVLDLVVNADVPLRFTDIHALSRQPRGTLHRHLSHLVQEGLLFQRADLAYEPGLRLLAFAHRAWSRNDLRRIARPHLDRLHAETGETVHLGVLRKTEIIYLDKVESRQTVRMESQIGRVSPAYCTGLGKAALSALSPARLEASLAAMSYHPFTANTHRSKGSLVADLDRIREKGYAIDAEEHEVEIRCVAAPVTTGDGGDSAATGNRAYQRGVIGGISVTGPAYRVTLGQLEAWSGLVKDVANAIAHDAAVGLGPVSIGDM